MARLFIDDYLFKGKHEAMVRELTSVLDPQSGTKLFSSAIELYMASAIIGAYYGLQDEPQMGDKTFRIMGTQFTSRADDLNFIYKLVMLNCNKESLQPVDRINNAFKYTVEDDEYKTNTKLFEKVMLGGLCEIYNMVIKGNNKRYDDYLACISSYLSKFGSEDVVSEDEIDFDSDEY